jgi:hypothetical protein
MLGDVTDICGRLRAVLPIRWFPDQSPTLNAVLTCIATPWAWLYGLGQYVITQTRLNSASGQWLDLISRDFFGHSLRRGNGEVDATYRARIQWALVQEAATRSAVDATLEHLTGFSPQIFEPANAGDTGAYGAIAVGSTTAFLGLAYGTAGGWGTPQLPFQFFVTVRRPENQGASSIAGYGTGFGGYGIGPIAYFDLALLGGLVDDEDIAQSLAKVLPVTTIAWLRIS